MPSALDHPGASLLRKRRGQVRISLSKHCARGKSRTLKESAAPYVTVPLVLKQWSARMLQTFDILGCVLKEQPYKGIASIAIKEPDRP